MSIVLEQVKVVSEEAYQKLLAMHDKTKEYHEQCAFQPTADSLDEMFVWGKTDEGHKYWKHIHKQITEVIR